MRHLALVITAVLAAPTVFGATQSEFVPKPFAIKLADIHPDCVFVRKPDDEGGAWLSFQFAHKSEGQVEAIFHRTRNRKRPVDVMDGDKIIAEATAGLVVLTSEKREKRYGLILAFASVEECR